MSALATAKSVVSHRGISCLELHRKLGELTRKVTQLTLRAEQATALEARIDEQAQTIGSLREQLASAKDIRDDVHAKAVRCDEAEAKATAAEKALTETVARIDKRHGEVVEDLEQQLAALHRRLDIACKAETAVTKTQPIPIITPVVPLHQSPLANPAHVPATALHP